MTASIAVDASVALGFERGTESVDIPDTASTGQANNDPLYLYHGVSDSRQVLSQKVGALTKDFCYLYRDLDGPAVRPAPRAEYLVPLSNGARYVPFGRCTNS